MRVEGKPSAKGKYGLADLIPENFKIAAAENTVASGAATPGEIS